jgi:hypothetical protein
MRLLTATARGAQVQVVWTIAYAQPAILNMDSDPYALPTTNPWRLTQTDGWVRPGINLIDQRRQLEQNKGAGAGTAGLAPLRVQLSMPP